MKKVKINFYDKNELIRSLNWNLNFVMQRCNEYPL